MAHRGYSRRRDRAPKPLSVPVLAMLIGLLVLFVGVQNHNAYDLGGLGLIFFFWGLFSSLFLVISRRRKARAARVRG